MLLGSRRYQRLVEECAGTFFLVRDLLVDFRKSCMEPLELYDPEIRAALFEHYCRIVYIRQPGDDDLLPRAKEVAAFLELGLESADADYTHLENWLRPRLG
jgi:hypothetical protein